MDDRLWAVTLHRIADLELILQIQREAKTLEEDEDWYLNNGGGGYIDDGERRKDVGVLVKEDVVEHGAWA